MYTDGKVILSGGAINSPQLLMLSGIGPAEELKVDLCDREQNLQRFILQSHGLDVRANMPGVGANLQDHLEIYVQQVP